jgi:predicted MFS family arabinose efflux permease
MSPESNTPPRLRYQLLAATFGRMVINTAQRMFYPFLPAFSRGLGIEIDTLVKIISLRGALGMISPFFGPLPDRFGRRNIMLVGTALFCVGLALVGVLPNLWTLVIAIMLVIVCKFLFDPALQAYLGERVPYSRRGLVIGLTEFGWSGAILLGAPLVGFLIERFSWRTPFLVIAVLGVIAGIWMALVIPADAPQPAHPHGNGLKRWLAVMRNPAVIGALTVDLLISAANEGISVVYGDWMENSFALTVAQLGLTGIIIGTAELLAEGGVAGLSDRMGKRQTIVLGLAVSALAYFALPLASGSLFTALGAIFFVYFAFEFAIVASIPLLSELVPESRSSVMSTAIASHAAGRMIGSLLGYYLYQYGFVWNGVVYGIMTLIGIPLILWVVRERQQ